jgi:hypothetical protein
MRPDIGDLIQGIKRTLTEAILPAVDTPFVREQIAYTLFLCEHLAARWDRAHLHVAAEHRDLRETLAVAAGVGRRCARPATQFAAVVDATAIALAAHDDQPRPLRELAEETRELKTTLLRFLEFSEDAAAADEAIRSELRGTLRAFMVRQLQRDEQWVAGAMIGWW